MEKMYWNRKGQDQGDQDVSSVWRSKVSENDNYRDGKDSEQKSSKRGF